jgi:hypothetical protein
MRKSITLALVLALTAAFTIGCDEYRKANRAVAGISSGLVALQEANQIAYRNGEISKDGAELIAKGLIDVSLLNDEAVRQLRGVKELDAHNIDQILALADQINSSLSSLQDEGVLHIKSDSSRQRFEASIVAVKGSVVILRGILQGVK